KRRRAEGGFIGADRILRELAEGTGRLRVGLKPRDRAPVREGAELMAGDGKRIGEVTSGTFGPSVGGPIAMGYVETAYSQPGTEVTALVRGKPRPLHVVKLPFGPHRYFRG